jgi:hypothetical protein
MISENSWQIFALLICCVFFLFLIVAKYKSSFFLRFSKVGAQLSIVSSSPPSPSSSRDDKCNITATTTTTTANNNPLNTSLLSDKERQMSMEIFGDDSTRFPKEILSVLDETCSERRNSIESGDNLSVGSLTPPNTDDSDIGSPVPPAKSYAMEFPWTSLVVPSAALVNCSVKDEHSDDGAFAEELISSKPQRQQRAHRKKKRSISQGALFDSNSKRVYSNGNVENGTAAFENIQINLY